MCTPKLSFAVVIPTLNAAQQWETLSSALSQQSLQPSQTLILDSTSDDNTSELASAVGYEVLSIPRKEFNHGLTRQIAIDRLTNVDVVVFLTQDAELNGVDSLKNIVKIFADPTVGAAYGRQIVRRGANAVEAHARLFNYPPVSQVNTWEDRHRLGIKAAFLSDSFSAYRRTAQLNVGGFPHTIIAEDALVAAKMLMAGWKTVYVADAVVVHSHHYTIREEFGRYFDTGVYHARESWLLENFGSVSEKGLSYVLSELKYVLKHDPLQLPSTIVRNAAKFVAYNLGRNEAKLSFRMRRRLSMQKSFWDADLSTRDSSCIRGQATASSPHD